MNTCKNTATFSTLLCHPDCIAINIDDGLFDPDVSRDRISAVRHPHSDSEISVGASLSHSLTHSSLNDADDVQIKEVHIDEVRKSELDEVAHNYQNPNKKKNRH